MASPFHLPAASAAGGQPRMSPHVQQHWQDCPPQWGGLPTPGGTPPPAFAAAAAAGTPPVFFTEAALTLDSPSSSGSPGHGGYSTHGPSPLSQPPPYYGQQHPAQHVAQHPPPPPPAHPATHQLQQLEQHNAELLRCCAQLQARLEATEQQMQAQAQTQQSAQHSQASPAGSVAGGSRSSQQEQQARPTPGRSRSALPSEELDPEERALLQRRLSAKQREAEAAAAALAAAQAATAQREGELEAERARAAALADEVARWKDECTQREKEARTLAQRLEAATAQCGLLDDSVAALKKKAGELSTALAQRDVAVRGLQDRLRSLQGSEGSRERQLDVLHAELEAARGERDATRREAAALQAENAELQAEVRRLDAAVHQARKEQAAALRSGSRDLELIAAAPPQRTSSVADGYGGPSFAPPPPAGAAHGQLPAGYAGGFGGSPFATEDTLQSMLQQTQALEDRLLKLNAERNELEAESARMPTHTTGRTQQERRRRAEVEGRLEEINKECSSIRLQLRRLGVK
ncbi:nuclear mitotic apparatus 1 isoform X2 [Chlorella sorokiniana]|uniref:Nuclear mitotic apparatus 1 isoform X2 n=1 Tax=Chlorella sorokiniana TaxID=3076 RepID=A0A2P6TI10_CHLSO|nr:nuclear mitotic apparatus 1 isoform X2 [Chlorella sorokiniana]|eukprot:PRW33935.1 nuclear mitotic apparatus 1 isoform X2 [Chlorella sorokiniana]